MNGVEGKVVLVTGAGKGAGRAAAQLLAARGARVAVNDISPVNLDALVAEGHGQVKSYPEDIAKKVGVQAVIKQVEDDFGIINILVNHAAVEPHIPLLDMDEWDWHRVLDVNLTGAFLTMQSTARVMKQAGSGVIINLISLHPKNSAAPAYAASMQGLVALTLAAADELSAYGIAVHAVGRGLERFESVDAATPRDFDGAILHLCGSKLNGQIVNVEG